MTNQQILEIVYITGTTMTDSIETRQMLTNELNKIYMLNGYNNTPEQTKGLVKFIMNEYGNMKIEEVPAIFDLFFTNSLPSINSNEHFKNNLTAQLVGQILNAYDDYWGDYDNKIKQHHENQMDMVSSSPNRKSSIVLDMTYHKFKTEKDYQWDSDYFKRINDIRTGQLVWNGSDYIRQNIN